jgi:hypothetical protein
LTLHATRGGYRDSLQKIWKETPLYPLILRKNPLNRARFIILQLPRKKFPFLWRIFELSQNLWKLIAFWRDMNDRSST